MQKIVFNTPTRISLIDMSSMGDSSKRDKPNLIGTFDSGLKYAIALLLRNCVDIKVETFIQNPDEEESFEFDTFIKQCDTTGKQKELIRIIKTKNSETKHIETGFAKALGFNWELWMALREIHSNMLDEDGCLGESFPYEEGTQITLTYADDNPFAEVIKNKHLYINEEEPLYKLSSSLEILDNPEGYLRIYKNNILVYKNIERKSIFAYNINFGQIDERRILSDIGVISNSIKDKILDATDKDFIRQIIRGNSFDEEEEDFLGGSYHWYGTLNSTFFETILEVHEEFGEYYTFSWIKDLAVKRKDYNLPGRKITTVEDSLWGYSSTVTVETMPKVVEDEDIKTSIEKSYKFKVDVDIKVAKIKGSKVVADKHNKCLILSESFDVAEDMPEFLVQYLDLTVEGNVLTNLSKFAVNLLKK